MKVDAALREHRHLLVGEEHHVAGVREDGGDVGGHEVLAVADADDERRAVAHGDDLVRLVGRQQDQREHPAHPRERPARRALEAAARRAAGLQFLLHQVRDDLGVGLRDELVPLALQLVLQLEVVLDDAVVHDHDAAGAVAVRVGVLLGRAAVRGPARVADAVFAVDRVGQDDLLEAGELPGAPAQVDGALSHHRDRRQNRSRGTRDDAGLRSGPGRPAWDRCSR